MPFLDLGKWDNGTMEVSTFPVERPAAIRFPLGVKTTEDIRFTIEPVQDGATTSRTGIGSLKVSPNENLLIPGAPGEDPPDPTPISDFTYMFAANLLGSVSPSLVFGRRYTVTAYVNVLSSVDFEQLADDNAVITIAPLEVLAGLKPGVNPVFINTTVGAAKNTWVQLTYEFTYLEGESDILPRFNVICQGILNEFTTPEAIANMDNDASFRLAGEMYIDDITVFEDPVAVCDLAFDAVPVDVQNEQTIGGNDGGITVNATSSLTIEYSIDGVNFQLANTFLAVPPGFYNVFARDALCTIATTATVLPKEVSNCAFTAPSNLFNFTRFNKIVDVTLTDLQNNGLPESCEDKIDAVPELGDYNNDFNNDFL